MDLARENQALHERLREEAARYDRRLDTYKLAQQRQAVLVSRLQAKVGIFFFFADFTYISAVSIVEFMIFFSFFFFR